MSEAPLIEVRDLAKTYSRPAGQVEVLKGVNLTIQTGASLALVGASGVGKSTLLHLLGALDRPSGGEVRFRGADIFRWDDDQLARFRNRSVGFVFQFHHLLPEFDALENVMMPLLVAGLKNSRARERAEGLLEQVGLKERMDHRAGELSGGEQQRVAVARALAMEPELLLADEPTGNLDAHTGRLISELILELNSKLGLTTVVATHNLELAATLDRMVRLVEGRALAEPAGEELT